MTANGNETFYSCVPKNGETQIMMTPNVRSEARTPTRMFVERLLR